MVPVVVLIGLAILSLGAYFLFIRNDSQAITPDSAFIVIISHDGQVQTVPSHEQTVGTLLKKLHVTINQGDVVEPALNTRIEQDDFRVNVYRAVPVQVVEGSKRTFAFSAATTPRSIADQAGYKLYAEDGVSVQPVANFIKQGSIGEQVVVDPSVPVHLNLYGTAVTLRTHASTVGDLLKQKKLSLAADDQVMPEPSTPIKPNQQIFLVRKGTKLQSIVEPIAMPIKTVNDSKLAYGVRAVRQQGESGKKMITYQVDKKTGHKKIIQTVIISSPVRQIVAIGTNLSGTRGDVARAGISASDYMYVDYIVEHESHWNPAALNSSGCAGLGQACPGSKLAAVCPDWQTDPVCQLRFFDGYARRTYDSWYRAYLFKVDNGWW